MIFAGAGFARMAARTALERTLHMDNIESWTPSRQWAFWRGNGPSSEYYRILDEATAAFHRELSNYKAGGAPIVVHL